MELSKKTTILFPPALHDQLTRLAKARGTSLGHLVRDACEQTYGVGSAEERLAAARALFGLELPVGSPEQLERESIPSPDDLMP